MSRVLPWFERKFDFSFPVELCPNVVARLRGTPARMEEILRICPEQIRFRKPEGKWSAQEHAGHLADLESLWTARVEDFARGGAELTVADLRNQKTSEANHNARPLEEILGEFRSGRMDMVNRVEMIETSVLGRTMLHPRLKKAMRLVDHLYFVAEHDDHHLAHILELVGS
jgi:DinB superfamily